MCPAAIEEAKDEDVGSCGEYFDENVLETVDLTVREYYSLILRNAAISNVVHKAEKVQLTLLIRDYLLLKIRKKFVQGISVFILHDDNVRLAPSEFLDALLDICKSLLCHAFTILKPRPSLAALLRIVAISQQDPLEHVGSL